MEQAKVFINFGFYNLHIVDLDGALKGKSFSKEIIKEIIKEEDDEPYREDVYRPDIRRRIRTPPFNYPTRGPPEQYDMVGFLQDSTDPNKLQQLFGRRTYPNSNNWNYWRRNY